MCRPLARKLPQVPEHTFKFTPMVVVVFSHKSVDSISPKVNNPGDCVYNLWLNRQLWQCCANAYWMSQIEVFALTFWQYNHSKYDKIKQRPSLFLCFSHFLSYCIIVLLYYSYAFILLFLSFPNCFSIVPNINWCNTDDVPHVPVFCMVCASVYMWIVFVSVVFTDSSVGRKMCVALKSPRQIPTLGR